MPAKHRQETATEELRRRTRELTILNAIAQALNREVDLDRALHAAMSQVAELLDLSTAWLFLMREGTNKPYLAAAQNLPPGLANAPRRMQGSCYCLDTYRQGDLRGAANVNVVTCSRLEELVDGTGGLAYHASIPLYAHGKKLGVLNVAGPDWRELSPEDLRLLYTVGDLIGIAIERARLFARSAQLAALEERNRLAREIHDTLAQGLSGIALHLEAADVLLETGADPEKAREAVGRALSLARANLEDARRSVLDLRAAPLQDRTLAEALGALAEERSEGKGRLKVDLVVKGASRPLPPRVETGLYRIAQEALTNVVRHAGAGKVMLTLVLLRGEVKLVVEDDGRGFDAERVPSGRYGLVGINERVKLLGGTFHLHTRAGSGTRLEVVVPAEGK